MLNDILSSLEDDYKVSDVRTCVYWIAVTSFRCGLASTIAASIFPSEGRQVDAQEIFCLHEQRNWLDYATGPIPGLEPGMWLHIELIKYFFLETLFLGIARFN
jgi:hypothetical protein